uniref:Uncharacterized protein n=1 Tax=Esocid herpesvirus 1 TaxID=1862331 RepID=A0A192GR04_9VIRU|nr:hypothetical protein EsHV1_ORF61 [Esocid herpesvirus 1]
MTVLPFKLLPTGAFHRASISFPGNTINDAELNERLLDHDDLQTFVACFGKYFNDYGHEGVTPYMLSAWLTESGLVVVRDVVSEFFMRITRALAKYLSGERSASYRHLSDLARQYEEIAATFGKDAIVFPEDLTGYWEEFREQSHLSPVSHERLVHEERIWINVMKVISAELEEHTFWGFSLPNASVYPEDATLPVVECYELPLCFSPVPVLSVTVLQFVHMCHQLYKETIIAIRDELSDDTIKTLLQQLHGQGHQAIVHETVSCAHFKGRRSELSSDLTTYAQLYSPSMFNFLSLCLFLVV